MARRIFPPYTIEKLNKLERNTQQIVPSTIVMAELKTDCLELIMELKRRIIEEKSKNKVKV